MESTENDAQNPTMLDEHSVEGAGLSSAMHDIRSMAARYESERGASLAGESLHLAKVTRIQPQYLLQPRIKSSLSERWKGAAMMLLMLLGLGTSAMALKLFSSPTSTIEPVYLQSHGASDFDKPKWDVREPATLPKEEPRLEVVVREPIALDTTSRGFSDGLVSSERLVVTPRISRAKRKPRAERIVESTDSCDEVACLIDPSGACCSQFESVVAQQPEVRDVSAYRPERSEVMRKMRGIEDDVLRCFETHGESGIASVDFVIQPNGSVREVELSQGALPFRSCIREEVRSLSFEPLRSPFKMSFPFRK